MNKFLFKCGTIFSLRFKETHHWYQMNISITENKYLVTSIFENSCSHLFAEFNFFSQSVQEIINKF